MSHQKVSWKCQKCIYVLSVLSILSRLYILSVFFILSVLSVLSMDFLISWVGYYLKTVIEYFGEDSFERLNWGIKFQTHRSFCVQYWTNSHTYNIFYDSIGVRSKMNKS